MAVSAAATRDASREAAREISRLVIIRRQRTPASSSVCDAECARLLGLAAGVGSGRPRRRLLADRAGHLARRALRASPAASSRDIDASVPVSTKVFPASGLRSRPARPCARRSSSGRPRAGARSARGCAARRTTRAPTRPATGPISGTGCSVVERRRLRCASIEPKWSASTCAPRSPTWRMPRA